MKSLYYCKCGKTFYKSTDSSTTGYRMPDYGPKHKCYGCPFICNIVAWDHERSVTSAKTYECRASKVLRYDTQAELSLEDKCVGRIFSLDLDFLRQIRSFADTLEGIEPDRYALSNRPSDYGNDGRFILSIYPTQNKKGIAAKQQIFDEFFHLDGIRKDILPEQEKNRILDMIKKSKEVRKGMGKLNPLNIDASLKSIEVITKSLDNLSHHENVQTDLIHPAKNNPYASDDTPESILELAEDIRTNGLIAPLAVNKISDDDYQLISGERRYKAIMEHLHWKTIPCMVYDHISPFSAALKLHSANLSVRDYTTEQKLLFYEETNRLLHAMKESGEYLGPIQKGIAELLGVSDRQVRKYKLISENLPEEAKQAVIRGDVSINDACRSIPSKSAANISEENGGIKSDSVPDNDPDIAESIPHQTVSESATTAIKTGTGSGFDETTEVGESTAKQEDSTDSSTHDADSRYWKPKILTALQQHYGIKQIFSYYLFSVPTTSEAIKDILKPQYGYSGGTVDYSDGAFGDCTAHSQKITIEHGKKAIDLTYSQADGIIREAIREGKWISAEDANAIVTKKYQITN